MDLGTLTIAQLLATLKDAGSIGILVFILVGGYKRWWVWGYQYDEVSKDRDEWKNIALSGTDVAKRIADVVEKKGI